MKQLINLAVASSVALASVAWASPVPVTVTATDVDAATYAPGDVLGLLGPVATTFGSYLAKGGFTDTYTFELTGSAIVSAVVGAGLSGLDISSISFDGGAPVSLSSLPTGLGFSLSLDKGVHTLSISGDVSGKKGDYYAGSIVAAPIPEPATAALVMASLGVIAGMTRRRRA